jgi:transcriptional regulator with XRE-family HTH domain
MDAEFKPDNRKDNSKPTVTIMVNGQKLQAFRQQAGMTQEQLAEKSGYTDRLIRKAEASSPLRKATLADLAAALSTPERTVTIADLTFSHETLAIEVLGTLLNGSSEFDHPLPKDPNKRRKHLPPANTSTPITNSLRDFIHSKLVLHVDGTDLDIPFANDYSGSTSFSNFRERLIQSVGSVQLISEQTRSFTSPGEVCVQATTEITPPAPSVPITVWWFMKVLFEANLIIKVELMYDTGNICRLLRNVSK